MHVAITGASSGIGEALAREFARAGAKLTLVARRGELLQKLAKEVGVPTHVVSQDLSKPAECTRWIAAAEAANGAIDVLVNNAGKQIVAPTAEVDPDEADALLCLDLLTPLRLTRAVLPAMIARKSGTIIDVASLAALAPTPGMTWYNAAKAGLAAASESLRGELRNTGVHVVTVYPGPVDTPMARAAYDVYESTGAVTAIPLGSTDELARKVRRAVERKQPRVIYPASYGITRHFPNVTRWALDRFTPPFKTKPGPS
jgi:short-subunit dehydrogenase